MFSAKLCHLPDGKNEASGEEVTVGRESGLEHRSLCFTVASPWALICQDPPIREHQSLRGNAGLPNSTLNTRLFPARPQVFCWPN